MRSETVAMQYNKIAIDDKMNCPSLYYNTLLINSFGLYKSSFNPWHMHYRVMVNVIAALAQHRVS